MCRHEQNFHGNLNGFLVTFSTIFTSYLSLKSVIPNFVACLVLLGMAFSFIKLISSSDTLPKREAAILKICPPAIIASAEVIIAEYDAILGQWECENFYNHLRNYTNIKYYNYICVLMYTIKICGYTKVTGNPKSINIKKCY